MRFLLGLQNNQEVSPLVDLRLHQLPIDSHLKAVARFVCHCETNACLPVLNNVVISVVVPASILFSRAAFLLQQLEKAAHF